MWEENTHPFGVAKDRERTFDGGPSLRFVGQYEAKEKGVKALYAPEQFLDVLKRLIETYPENHTQVRFGRLPETVAVEAVDYKPKRGKAMKLYFMRLCDFIALKEEGYDLPETVLEYRRYFKPALLVPRVMHPEDGKVAAPGKNAEPSLDDIGDLFAKAPAKAPAKRRTTTRKGPLTK